MSQARGYCRLIFLQNAWFAGLSIKRPLHRAAPRLPPYILPSRNRTVPPVLQACILPRDSVTASRNRLRGHVQQALNWERACKYSAHRSHTDALRMPRLVGETTDGMSVGWWRRSRQTVTGVLGASERSIRTLCFQVATDPGCPCESNRSTQMTAFFQY